MIYFLRILFIILFLTIVYTIVSTSLQSNLFEEWGYLSSIPWMRATLIDFYINEIIIFLWVWYREFTLAKKVMWGVLFFCLGGIATTLYVLIVLFKANSTATPEEILTGGKNAK